MLMARRSSAAVAALALGTLAACSDLTSPDALLVQDGPGARLAANANELPVLASARINAAEPAETNPSRFDIHIRYVSPVTPAQQAVFEQAVARWESLITRDLPSVSGSIPANAIFPGQPAFSGTIDDLMIDVLLLEIDGPGGEQGNILGAASPAAVRTGPVAGTNLPVYGYMIFDTYDLDFLASLNLLDEVIVHEMGHVVGIGSLWNFRRSLRTPTYDFVGKHANNQFAEIGGTGLVPVEDQYGPGTRGGHWRESSFHNELMTGFLNLGSNPLSRVTAGSLRDLGYYVNLSAEEYSLPATAPAASLNMLAAPGVDGLDIAAGEEIREPLFVVR
jgi:hypothetical protein